MNKKTWKVCHLETRASKSNIRRVLMYNLIAYFILGMLYACQPSKNAVDKDTEEWISLFNGTDLSGWDIKIAGYALNDNYNETFVVQDSMIRIQYDHYEEFNDAFGHMYYKEPFSYPDTKLVIKVRLLPANGCSG